MRPLLHIVNISVYFSGKVCLEDFSATVHSHDRLAIVGDNGSGKSSLLKALVASQVSSDNECRIGYLPQQIQVSSGQTPRQLLGTLSCHEAEILLH